MYGNNEGLERNITDILARMRKQRMPKENIDVIVSWVNFLKAKGSHERLAVRLMKITKEEIINQIKSGMPLQVRGLSVFDSKTRICGRIDQLRMTGTFEGNRHTGIIIDDKYPKDPNLIHGLTLYYKLQLSSYAVALENSDQYGSLCKVEGAELIYREKATDKVIKSYEMDRKRLGDCASNVGAAVDDAWSMYQKKKEAEHRRFDVEIGEWVGCYCDGAGMRGRGGVLGELG